MTAKIVPFPTLDVQSLAAIDKLIRTYLAEMTADNNLIDYVGDRMKDFIEKYAYKSFVPSFHLAIPPHMSQPQVDALLCSIEEGLQRNAGQMQEMINKIIFERLYREVEIYEQLDKIRGLK
ncbi:MAG: hypothetical protein ABFC57_15450 [Veillonellales bacterium]